MMLFFPVLNLITVLELERREELDCFFKYNKVKQIPTNSSTKNIDIANIKGPSILMKLSRLNLTNLFLFKTQFINYIKYF